MKAASCIARLISLSLLAFAYCAAVPQPASPSSSAHAPAPRTTVIGVSNFAEVTPKLFRGGQPKGKGFDNLKRIGIDMIVDLRLSGIEREKQNATQARMQFVSLPWHCVYPRDEVFSKFLRLLQKNQDKKIFVHCRYGDDRTGMMIAAFRMAMQGWSAAEAAREMRKFGYHRAFCPTLVRYERSFPKRLQTSPEFDEWRSHSSAKAQ